MAGALVLPWSRGVAAHFPALLAGSQAPHHHLTSAETFVESSVSFLHLALFLQLSRKSVSAVAVCEGLWVPSSHGSFVVHIPAVETGFAFSHSDGNCVALSAFPDFTRSPSPTPHPWFFPDHFPFNLAA